MIPGNPIMTIEMEENVIDVLAKLRAQAAARRMPLDAYLQQFVEPEEPGMNGHVSLAEFDKVLDELDALPPPGSCLPNDFSRADIYAEHD
jgi:hypothetical protein